MLQQLVTSISLIIAFILFLWLFDSLEQKETIMKQIKYAPTLHNGEFCPVPPNKKVVYRTLSPVNGISHIHAPVEAQLLTWTTRPIIGRIIDYMVV